MRRTLSAVLMMLCLLLTSCGTAENGVRDAMTFRELLQESGGCSFTADVVTEIENRGYEFTLAASYQCGGSASLTVTAMTHRINCSHSSRLKIDSAPHRAAACTGSMRSGMAAP